MPDDGPLRGGSLLRRWRVEATGAADELRVVVWTPVAAKLVLGALLALAIVPAPMLWDSALDGVRIAAWVTATVYSLVVASAAIGVTHLASAERLCLGARDLVMERFAFGAWALTSLERDADLAIAARRGRSTAAFNTMVIGSRERTVTFGTWLSPDDAERVAALVRAACAARETPSLALDGVVRRVATLTSDATLPGAASLLVLEGRHGCRGDVDRLLRSRMRLPLRRVTIVLGVVAVALLVRWGRAGPLVSVAVIAAFALVARLVDGGRFDLVPRLRARRPAGSAPWLRPRCWRTPVMRVSPVHRAVGPAALLVLAFGFAAWVGMDPRGGRGPGASPGAGIAIGLAGLVGIAAIWRLQNVLFMGATELRLRAVPLRVGDEVVLDFAVARRGGDFETILFELRRIVEVSRGLQSPLVACSHVGRYALPEDTPAPGPGEQVSAHFRVPATAGGTRLERDRTVVWELLVTGRTSCGAYEEAFPIPVFEMD